MKSLSRPWVADAHLACVSECQPPDGFFSGVPATFSDTVGQHGRAKVLLGVNRPGGGRTLDLGLKRPQAGYPFPDRLTSACRFLAPVPDTFSGSAVRPSGLMLRNRPQLSTSRHPESDERA